MSWRAGSGFEFRRKRIFTDKRCFGIYDHLEAEGIKYIVRLPANRNLQERIGYLLSRPVGRPPNEVRRYDANFSYQAGSRAASSPREIRWVI